MSSIVSINLPAATATLGPHGSASVRFVVTHKGTQPIKIGYRTVPEGRLPARALVIRGGRALELPAGGVAELVVDVKPGATLAPGDYRFSLLVFDVADPGERFDESSAVTVTVPAPVTVVAPLRRPWKQVLIAAALATVVALTIVNSSDTQTKGLSSGLNNLLAFLALVFAPGLMAGAATRLGQAWSVVGLGALVVPCFFFLYHGAYSGYWLCVPVVLFAAYLVIDGRREERRQAAPPTAPGQPGA